MKLRALLPALLLAATAYAGDWPQYRGPHADGISPETIAPWIKAPKQIWKIPIDGGFSSFAIGGGKAFTLALREVDGVSQETLIALNAEDGKELWVSPLNSAKYDGGGNDGTGENNGGDGPRSTPCIIGETVATLSSQLVLRCFETMNGSLLWSHDLIAEYGAQNIQWQNAASPILDDGLLYVAGGSAGQSLFAFDPADGRVVWKAFDEKITHASPVPATIHGKRQIIFFLQSGLLSVDPKTGAELWRYAFRFNVSTAASPVQVGDIVYCSAAYGVGAGAVKITLDGDRWSAKELYRVTGNKPLANHWSTPVAKDGFLYGMFQFKEYGKGPVKCVDAATGKVKWEQPGFGPGQVILAGKRVVALSDAGELVLIDPDPAAYKEAARTHILDGKCWTTPALADGRIYARSTKEAVCIDVSGK